MGGGKLSNGMKWICLNLKVYYICGMIEGYEFVYALSSSGQVFYIGRTKDVCKRYDQHLLSGKHPITRVARYISILLAFGHTPVIRIIDYLPADDAKKREDDLICSLKMAGQDTLNGTSRVESQYFNKWPKWAPLHPSKSEMREVINALSKARVLFTRQNIKK